MVIQFHSSHVYKDVIVRSPIRLSPSQVIRVYTWHYSSHCNGRSPQNPRPDLTSATTQPATSTRLKIYADLRRKDHEFSEGDWVYLRFQPYKQTTVALRRSNKLAPRFLGPFQILHRVEKVAYRLHLPGSSKIHPTFHVSQLKKKLGSSSTAVLELPPWMTTMSLNWSLKRY